MTFLVRATTAAWALALSTGLLGGVEAVETPPEEAARACALRTWALAAAILLAMFRLQVLVLAS